MTKRDYYEVLGIGRDTGTDDIKKAYRKLAMKFHPDRNPGSTEAEDKFKEAAEAYDVLSDSEKRQRYDQFGHEGVRSTGYRGYSNVEDIFRNFGDFFNDFGDIFDGFGGGRKSGGRRSHTYQGQDLQVKLGLTLEEIQTGITKKVKIKNLSPVRHAAAPVQKMETPKQVARHAVAMAKSGRYSGQLSDNS